MIPGEQVKVVRSCTVVLVLLAFVVITAPVHGREAESRSEPPDNRFVKVSYYTEESPSRTPRRRYVLFAEFGVATESIGQVEYGILVDEPDLIDRLFSLAYFGAPGKDICPTGKRLNASGQELSEEDQQTGFYGATAGEYSLSPRRSLYVRIYSSEPVALVDCFVERIDGAGQARAACVDLQLEVVTPEPCESRPFTYEPYEGD